MTPKVEPSSLYVSERIAAANRNTCQIHLQVAICLIARKNIIYPKIKIQNSANLIASASLIYPP